MSAGRRVARPVGSGIAAGISEARKRDALRGAALHGYSGYGGGAAGAGSRSAGAGGRRKPALGGGVGNASCARFFPAEAAFGCAAGRQRQRAAAGRVRQSCFGSGLAGHDDPVAGSVSPGITRRSYGRTEVERTSSTSSFVAASAAREGFAAA